MIFWAKVTEHNVFFLFPLQRLFETFLILRIIQLYTNINVHWSDFKET